MLSNESMQIQMEKEMEKQWAIGEERYRIFKNLLDAHDRRYKLGLITPRESQEIMIIIDEVLYGEDRNE